jgi:hypothetical protein
MKLKTAIRTLALIVVSIGLATKGHCQSFLTNGLVAYFPFNGNANDASGNGNNGTVNGATLTPDRFGQTNQAYLFSGTDTYISVPLASAVFSNDFTASVWFQVQNFNASYLQLLFEEGETLSLQLANQHLTAYSADIGPSFCWYLGRTQQTAAGTVFQVVVTKAGDSATMYLNSQVAVTGNVTKVNPRGGTNLYIGRGSLANIGFHGVIDDIRIYSRALSASEVTMLYENESGPRVNLIKAVKPSFTGLYIGTNYQLQVSSDMSNWTNYGDPFPATNSSMVYPQYWDVDNWGKLFFQLKTAMP